MRYGFINDRAAKLLITDRKLRDFVSIIISKLLEIDFDYVKENLQVIHNGVNVNQNLKGRDTDALFENNYSIINFEFNSEYQPEYITKNNMYVFHLYLGQLKPGEKDKKIKPVNQININNYDIYGKEKFIYKTQLCETRYNLVRDNNLVIYDINMDFLKKLSYNELNGMPSDSLEKIFLIFYKREDINYENFYNGNPLMERVVKRLEEMWKDFDDMLYYDAAALRQQVEDRLRKENEEKMRKELTDKVTKDVTEQVTKDVTEQVTKDVTEQVTKDVRNETQEKIASKMIKDGLLKQQVIKYSQISEEEYEMLKRKVFDK